MTIKESGGSLFHAMNRRPGMGMGADDPPEIVWKHYQRLRVIDRGLDRQIRNAASWRYFH